MTIKTFVFNTFQENTYLLFDETNEAVLIDAGCYSQQERDKLSTFIEEKNLTLKKLLNTHSHIDHILGNQFIIENFNLDLESNKDDEFLIKRAKDQGAAFGISIDSPPLPKKHITEGDKIKFGNSVLEIIHTPGHSPGSIVFYNKNEKFMIVGDVLFNQSIGRTDLPGGDYDTLLNSITNKLFPLGDDMEVYCGHGPNTTIGQERISNPFL
ncbi:MAG: MBL fold metallo-hydrolase [Bacteroidales bacterium]|nr:MBL fold metallo-hydrolase [Bacteroidales bacterium]MBN2756562.1 MBL fold metallo-hydrolase [Bacteroidales bacterium]